MIPILLATRNAHKTAELSKILGPEFCRCNLESLRPFPEVEETGNTFEENAVLKAVAASHVTQMLVVADDSGLEVDDLGGAPGIYSARYAGEGASDEQNVSKLLAELRIAAGGNSCRAARFQCALAVAHGGAIVAMFRGTIEGTITDLPSGQHGFGYDPVFVPKGFDNTLAELPEQTKNRISHRAQAAAQLQKWVSERKPRSA